MQEKQKFANPVYYTRTAKLLHEKQDPWKQVPLNRDNWWFVQLNATITTTFYKHGVQDPVYVYVEEEIYTHVKAVKIMVVRAPITSQDEFDTWIEKRIYIEEELKAQAYANSDEDACMYDIFLV